MEKYKYKDEIYVQRMYSLGRCLLKYFNGLEIDYEEASLIANSNPNEIITAIGFYRSFCINGYDSDYFDDSTSKIKTAKYVNELNKNKKKK